MGHGVGHHIDISIHALREEGDAGVFSQIVDLGVFLSTPSVRRATRSCSPGWSAVSYFYPRPPRGGRHRRFFRHDQFCDISIHALREEGDDSSRNSASASTDFYPRPPRGGRPSGWKACPPSRKFLSTPSARRATAPLFRFSLLCRISIHALREEGDLRFALHESPRREISIHALREEGDSSAASAI